MSPHLCALPNPKFGLRGQTAGQIEGLYTLRRKDAHEKGIVSSPSPHLSKPPRRLTFLLLFQQPGNWGRLWRPGKKARRPGEYVALEAPFSLPFPYICTSEPLTSGRSPAADTLRPPGCPDTQRPQFLLNTSPHLHSEQQPPPSMRKCTRRADRRLQPPIRSPDGREAWPMRVTEVSGGGARAARGSPANVGAEPDSRIPSVGAEPDSRVRRVGAAPGSAMRQRMSPQ
ncbi:uncharacterized protein LOC119512279 [Choloepus didactylus]|uniref:uncharacterized protein LOC119512279 n=1 Tax=Choloepus didactylus TaxID=27675 RepID=UPI0018A0E0C1|nr:uncharacterized protein LOC119512279 [Choloepus didactylus]